MDKSIHDLTIHDFSNASFQVAFKKYFAELGIEVEDWEGLFQEMNDERNNVAIVRTSPEGETVGFIQFKIDLLKNWFFEEKIGFIREFWVSDVWRHRGHGTALLQAAEDYFRDNHVHKAILTTDTAPDFYIHQGYVRDPSYSALNKDEIFIKILK